MNLKWTITKFENHDLSEIRIFFKRFFTGLGSYGSIDLFNWKIQENYVSTGILNLIKAEMNNGSKDYDPNYIRKHVEKLTS